MPRRAGTASAAWKGGRARDDQRAGGRDGSTAAIGIAARETFGFRRPDTNLAVGSGPHGAQTALMLRAIEEVLVTQRPDFLLVYGDTNSTLAGAMAASKLSIPIAHVEAGLRSFDRRMPEEVNRVVTDHLSDILFCPSNTAVVNLANEGIWSNVHVIGDVMLDVLKWATNQVKANRDETLERFGVTHQGYVLATVHRCENTDDPIRFASILEAINSINERVLFPVHPRARRIMNEMSFTPKSHVNLLDPVGYLDMVALLGAARIALTDSGGLQKEAYWLGVPCLTLREETEWVETVESGWNVLVGTDSRKILSCLQSHCRQKSRLDLYGDGDAAASCVKLLESNQERTTASKRAEYASWNR